MNEHLHISAAGLHLEHCFGRGPRDISPHGFATRAYSDTGGRALIGWRHRIRSSGDYMRTVVIDSATAEQLLAQDNAEAESAIKRLVTVDLNQHEFDALCSFVQDVGVAEFEASSALTLVNAGDRTGAAFAIRARTNPGEHTHCVRRLAESNLFLWRPHA